MSKKVHNPWRKRKGPQSALAKAADYSVNSLLEETRAQKLDVYCVDELMIKMFFVTCTFAEWYVPR